MGDNFNYEALASQQNSKYDAIRRWALISSDMLALLFSVILGWSMSNIIRGLINPKLTNPPIDIQSINQIVLFGVLVSGVIILSWIWGHYSRFQPFWDELKDIIKIAFYVVVIDVIYMFSTKYYFSRVWFFSTIILMILLVPVFRVYAKRLMMRAGVWLRPTVIIGAGPNALDSAKAIESDPSMGHQVVAFLSPTGQGGTGDELAGCPVLPMNNGEPEMIYERMGSPYIVFALESYDQKNGGKTLLDHWMSMCSTMTIVPPVSGLPLYSAEIIPVLRYETVLLRVNNNLMRRWHRAVKRAFDIVVSVSLMIMLSPVFMYCYWKVRQDGGSATYAHKRVGYKGKHFNCLKFRSMCMNADGILEELLESSPEARAEWEKDFKLKDDPRITKIGIFLRKTSLDELPQLWNVFKGDMSLVGPRPIVDDELERYDDFISYYKETRPGMTGLWQVSGRNDVSYKQRVSLDVWYARNWSLWYDIVILLKTIPVIFLRKGSY